MNAKIARTKNMHDKPNPLIARKLKWMCSWSNYE